VSRQVEALWYPEKGRSLGGRMLRAPLALPASLFAAGVALRNLLYDARVVKAEEVPGLRVLSVGNLTAGGAGKTPVVAFLAERLLATGARVAVLSRGYGRRARGTVQLSGPPWPPVEEVGDEPLLLAQRLPRAEVWVGENRVELAHRARAAGATAALLDDGFQHRRLARAVDAVVLDEAVGLGNGHLLPWGPLREPPSALSRATLLWLRAAEQPAPLPPLPAGLPLVRARHAARDVLASDGAVRPLAELTGVRLVAFCGIARPSSFARTLAGLGAEVLALRAFSDHHPFTPEELEGLRREARGRGAALVTTEKDAVRLPPGFPSWVLRLHVTLLEGEAELARVLGA
jgi:tetraacyldisaccharide 4'-kinase